MEKSSLRGYHKLSGSNSATSPPTSTAIDLIEDDEEFGSDRARKTLQIEDVDDAAKGWRSRRGCRDKIEGEGESVSLESSEEVDEHRLLSVSCSGGSIKSTGQSGYPQATRINLSQQQQEEEDWNEEDIDPFSYCPPLTKWDKFKVTFNALWLLPLRLFLVVIPATLMGVIVCTLAIICDRFDENNPQPLNKWGRFVMNNLGKIATRIFLFGFGFNWIKTRGVPAPTKEAPILVVSPHSSLLDMFIISLYKVPTYLARADLRGIPVFGKLITKTLRTIYVEREDPQSRVKAAEEIRRRTHTRGEWPKVLIFPEGTTTNRTALITFKQGAFLPKLPVQPVLIKYKNKLSTAWAEQQQGLIKSLLFTLCQLHNSLEVEFLPIYHPSEEEKSDTKLFARNVQILMARTLGVPYTNHALEDMLLMRSASQAGLPPVSGIVIYHNVTKDMKMDFKTIKKWLRRFAAMDSDKDGYVTLEDFAHFLQLPNDASLQAVFTSANKNGNWKLSFRHYLYGIIGKANPLLQDENFMQSMFNFFDGDGDGTVSLEDVSSRLPIMSLPRVEERHRQRGRGRQQSVERQCCDVSYQNPEGTPPEEMNQEQFSSLLAFHPEYILIFYECQQAGVSSPSVITPLVTNGNSHPSVTTAASLISGRGSVKTGHMIRPISAQIKCS